jgi:hypothetical protein
MRRRRRNVEALRRAMRRPLALAAERGTLVLRMASIAWSKGVTNGITATTGPFSLEIQPKGDGRWSWRIFQGGADNPTATGIAGSLAAAKNVTEQFVKRSGLL